MPDDSPLPLQAMMDPERFHREWCYTRKTTTRYRLWALRHRLRRFSEDERAGLARFVLDRARNTYFDPRFGAKNRLVHNVYHTIRCLLSGLRHRAEFFLPMLRLALNVQHCYLHERFFSFLLHETDPKTALGGLEMLYESSNYQRRADYVRALLPRITEASPVILRGSVIGLVNEWGDRAMHEEVLFHPVVRADQHEELLTGFVRELGHTIERLSDGDHHRERLRRLVRVVDRLLISCPPSDGDFSPALRERVEMAARSRATRAAVMEQVRTDVAYRPGNHGMEDAMEDFFSHARKIQ